MSSEEIPEKRKIKGDTFDITVDNKASIELAKENQKLKDDMEKKGSVAERKLEMYKQTNEHRYLDCSTMDEIRDLTTSLMRETVDRRKNIPSGSAELTPRQMGEKPFDIYTHKWSSEKEMTDFLYEHHNEDTDLGRECDGYLTQMLRKWAHDFRTHPEHSQQFYNPNTKESLPPLKPIPNTSGLQTVNPEDSDIQKILKRWRDERLRKMRGVQA